MLHLFFLDFAKPSSSSRVHSTIKPARTLAEREGFEPSMGFCPYSLSRGAPSTTRPPLQCLCDQFGAPDRTRTCSRQFRRLVPYPVWPQAHGLLVRDKARLSYLTTSIKPNSTDQAFCFCFFSKISFLWTITSRGAAIPIRT